MSDIFDVMKEHAPGIYEGCLTYKCNMELFDWYLTITDIEMNENYDCISFGKVRITIEKLDSDI